MVVSRYYYRKDKRPVYTTKCVVTDVYTTMVNTLYEIVKVHDLFRDEYKVLKTSNKIREESGNL